MFVYMLYCIIPDNCSPDFTIINNLLNQLIIIIIFDKLKKKVLKPLLDI